MTPSRTAREIALEHEARAIAYDCYGLADGGLRFRGSTGEYAVEAVTKAIMALALRASAPEWRDIATAPLWENTNFGLAFNERRLPPNCDAVVLCVDLYQHEPLCVLLPHQVYVKRLDEILAHHAGARSFTVIPYRNCEKIEITMDEVRRAAPPAPRPTEKE